MTVFQTLTPEQKKGLTKACKLFEKAISKLDESMKGLEEAGEMLKKISPQEMKDLYDRDTLGYYLLCNLESASLDLEFRVKHYWLRQGFPFLNLCKIIPQVLNKDPLVLMSQEQWDGLEQIMKRYEHFLGLLDVAFDLSEEATKGVSLIEQEYALNDNEVARKIVRTLYGVHDYFNDYAGEYTNSHEGISFIHRILTQYRQGDRDKS